MLQRAAFLGGVLGVLVLAQLPTAGQQGAKTPSGWQPVHATSIAEIRSWDAFVTSESRAGGLRLRSVRRDPDLPSRTVERFDQLHDGVRIWGSDIVRDSDRGVTVSIFGTVAPDLQVSTEPRLSRAAAEDFLRAGDSSGTLLTEPELIIVPLSAGEAVLAYTGVVSRDNDIVRRFVNADDGSALFEYTEIRRQQPAVGTGTGVLGDTKKLSTESNASGYIAFDRHRPPTIQTFDLRGDLTRAKALINRSTAYTTGDLARDDDNVWTDPSTVDAHVHVSWTYDYYYKRFGRNGFDDRNGPVNILVNPVLQRDALNVSTSDRASYVLNAFFAPFGGPNNGGILLFGSGMPSGVVAPDGRTYTYLSGALDVAAHELTHAVTNATSNLVYLNESGALNEAFSDMMGKGVEFFYRTPGGNAGQADYVVGKDVVRSGRSGVPHGIRSMANPQAYGDPDHYAAYARLASNASGDNGGVHINSGIPNQAFYLAIEGGTNRTSSVRVQGVGAANRAQIERVFFRAFALLLPANATFITAREATIQAARDLFPGNGSVEQAVTQAWNAVGVPAPGSVGVFSGQVAARGRQTWTINMNADGIYQANVSWNSPATTDIDVYLTRAGCPVTQAGCILDFSETEDALEHVAWRVRSGESYWLTINNFAGAGAAYTVQHWIAPAGTGTAATLPLGAPLISAGDTK